MRISFMSLIFLFLLNTGCSIFSSNHSQAEPLGAHLILCKINILKQLISMAVNSDPSLSKHKIIFQLSHIEYNKKISDKILHTLQKQYPQYTFTYSDFFDNPRKAGKNEKFEQKSLILIRLHPQIVIPDSHNLVFFGSLSIDSSNAVMYKFLVNEQKEIINITQQSCYKLN